MDESFAPSSARRCSAGCNLRVTVTGNSCSTCCSIRFRHPYASIADLPVDLDIAEIDRHVREILRIEGTLRRMAEGRYGYCVYCGNAIAAQWLQTSPTVACCYDCQVRFESEQIGGAPPTL